MLKRLVSRFLLLFSLSILLGISAYATDPCGCATRYNDALYWCSYGYGPGGNMESPDLLARCRSAAANANIKCLEDCYGD